MSDLFEDEFSQAPQEVVETITRIAKDQEEQKRYPLTTTPDEHKSNITAMISILEDYGVDEIFTHLAGYEKYGAFIEEEPPWLSDAYRQINVGIGYTVSLAWIAVSHIMWDAHSWET
jgi:hypothetical protein